MSPNTAPASEQVCVHPAPAPLAAWCLCLVVRRVHAGPVSARVQASTWASLNVVVEGQVRGPAGALPARFITAPFAAPLETRVPGPLLSACLVLQPWALEPLAGIAAGRVGATPLDVSALAAPVRHLCEALHGACAGAEPSRLWAALLEQQPRVLPATPGLALATLAAAGVEAAAASQQVSARQYLRRFRHAMGLPPATWLRIRRWETALRAMAAHDAASIAQLSLQHGFADQAHLARDTRALGEETPVRLRRLLHRHDGPWSLRPAHVRFVQDEGEAHP